MLVDDDHEEVEPLEVVPVPVLIEAYDPDVGDRSVVRLFFRAGDHGGWPGGGVSEVVLNESSDRVSVALFRRVVTGEAPDGMMYGESLQMGVPVSLDVALARPLGSRTLLDASTGEAVSRVERPSEHPLPAEAGGTPLWRWS